MRYLISIAFIFSLVSCNQSPSTSTTVETKQPQTDSVTDKNLVYSPEEMHDDSVFDDGSRPSEWTVAGIEDPNQLKIFIKNLRFWVEHGNKDSIAKHVQYPLKNKGISSSGDFIKNYDILFNTTVIKALNDQKLSQIFRNQQGVMIGKGELWIRNFSSALTGDFKITAINN